MRDVPILHADLPRYYTGQWVRTIINGHPEMVKSGDGVLHCRLMTRRERIIYWFRDALEAVIDWSKP